MASPGEVEASRGTANLREQVDMTNATTPPPPPYTPRLHDTVMDTGARKVGRVMGLVGPYVQLRPVGGGLEWDARPEDLRPATIAEALSAGVALANARSRGERP